jgi:RimJ/RimL family protein N-acetyltransferase
MEFTDSTLLRLHVEASWDVRFPASVHGNEIDLLRDGSQPNWRLCAADMAEGRVHIWRPDVTPLERAALRVQVSGALAGRPEHAPLHGVQREVALALTTPPRLDEETILKCARPLTVADRALIEAFDPGWLNYYFAAQQQPLIGTVITGRLVSVAHSSRRTSEACELGVLTLPDARRKGYALAATVAWTQRIVQEMLVPLYSADVTNDASLRLADAAGYRSFARLVTFE